MLELEAVLTSALQATLAMVKIATFAFPVTSLALLARTRIRMLVLTAEQASHSKWPTLTSVYLTVAEATTQPKVKKHHALCVIGPVLTAMEKPRFAQSATDKMNSLFQLMGCPTLRLCLPYSTISAFQNALKLLLAKTADVSGVKIHVQPVKISQVFALHAILRPTKSTYMPVSATRHAQVVLILGS